MSPGPDLLFHGDNLRVLREHFADGTVDLCYIDPPFHSRRDYYPSQTDGKAPRPRAFSDRWTWDDAAADACREISEYLAPGQTPACAALFRGLHGMLGEGGLLAYLANFTLRLVEVRRVLAPHGTFYLHADPSAVHYLKLICDALFLPGGGEFRNEIVWSYESGGRGVRDFPWKHDTILRYTKSAQWTFDASAASVPRGVLRRNHLRREVDADGRVFRSIRSAGKLYRYYDDEGTLPSDVWTDVSHLHQRDPERVGYPTQKPEALLARIVAASSRPGDLVLDAYCGGGTTLVVAQKLGRRWAGIDQSAEAIATTRRRLAALITPGERARPDTPPGAPAATAGPTPG